MTIIQASFFWKNDEPGGLGFTFGPPMFTPKVLSEMFNSVNLQQYYHNSDRALGSGVVKDYLAQLETIGQAKRRGIEIPLEQAILAALNIMWLSSRGFIPNDEFNGVRFFGVTA